VGRFENGLKGSGLDGSKRRISEKY